ncbi:uncharacterized protein EDB91DRAFT_1143252 [Suillus paluster]|uniref:uncharacterized protein n=1 Tax=Suillus paluster TaxID=48578 RepID=UPI001B880BA1|nr:uncharacterized protein EDB91DRAFT_1143252 [Suillus paluster]KAG1735865.1 hypothetical protein EDB91DRAFT_1143252 [Suillus paluster]
MTYLYLAVSSALPTCSMVFTSLLCQVRYFGIFLAMLCASWGGLINTPESSYVTNSLYI